MAKELGLTASFPKGCLDNMYDKNYHPSKYLYQDIIENKPKILLAAYKNCKTTSAVLFVCRNDMFCKWTTFVEKSV